MTAVEPTLFATAATVRAVEQARAAVFLIGGYDGSGNYGDIALLSAATDLVGQLGAGITPLPVLEREYLASHRELAESSGVAAPLALFFDPTGKLEDDLLPVPAPAGLAFAASYLYGGGYLNRLWGGRKLAMLAATDALLAAGGAKATCRLSSGLQVEPDWIAALAERDGSALGSLDFLGARDGASQRALAGLDSGAPAVATGDDAIGLLQRLPAANGHATSGERLHLNLHFSEHDWVSERPRAVLDFYAGFVAELGRLADRPVVARPLIAYLDRRVDERAAVERLAETCAAAGVEVLEPLLLRPAALAEAAPRVGEASLTLSCSFHVALTSLMLEVPAVLLGDNPYYEQKAAGLAADFELPPAFTTSASADPVASARQIAAEVLGDSGAALRQRLAAGASRQRQRRAAAETELLARLGGAAMTALAGRVDELEERLRQRSAEPAELQARLAELRTEVDELRRRLDESPLDAELRVQEAEARAGEAHETLAAVLGSRSWRMAAPLRRIGSLLRRH